MKVLIGLFMLAGVIAITATSHLGYSTERARQMAEQTCLNGGPSTATEDADAIRHKAEVCNFALTGEPQ